jgi:hypothetical protein
MADESGPPVMQLVPVGDPELVPTMVSDIASAKHRLQELQAFVREVMVEGEDYGAIPGTEKPALLKPGAEKLCEIYGLIQAPEVVTRIEDWDAPFFHYEVRCNLVSKRTGRVIGAGLGSCNSHEPKYRWRIAERKCPICDQASVIRGKEEYGGGWLCFRKKGGCGAKFPDDSPEITDQTTGRVPNEDAAGLVNTLLKMAKKRALVDAVLSVTRSSGLFTQDEDALGGAPDAAVTPAKPSAPPGASPAGRISPSGRTVTGAQQAILLRRAESLGLSQQTVVDYIGRTYGALSLEELPFEHLNQVLKWVEEHRAMQEPGVDG